MEDLIKYVQDYNVKLREEVNRTKENTLGEVNRLDHKMDEVAKTCFEMPPRLR